MSSPLAPPIDTEVSQPSTPSGGNAGVLDNGTNLGSALGRKPSVGHRDSLSMEQRTSSSQPGSRRGSRRGSGVFTTPSGTQVVYHTRTHDEVEFPHAEKKTIADHLRKFESLLTLTPQRMRMIVHAIEETLDRGLQKDGQVVPMIPTFVFGWPTGEEKGDYLALDLGGTNLRVCLVTLQGGGKFEVTQTKYRLTEEQKQEDGQKLLDFCAECLDSFIRDSLGRTDEDEKLPLGFTFSYPCSQARIDHGELIRWTKGFGAPNIEGRDVAAMFADSLKRLNVPCELTALINDTTGTLVASNYVDPHTKIAVIFGTGCNAAYMETSENIPKMSSVGLPDGTGMAINCEWGAFDSFDHQHLPRTKYDIIIDESSNKPGEQAFEKMIAGLYLGEVFRLILCDLIDSGDLFLGQNTYKLEKAYAFDTAFLSLMESDPTDELLTVIGIFTHFFGIETTVEERQFFKQLAVLIGTRAARLSACGIAAIVSKKGYLEEGCAVGADGSLYNKYPNFANRVHEALVDIFGEKGKNIVTHHAEDGSGVGSAIIAAMTKARKEKGFFVDY
ncbi:putative hexokinase [Papiliotrema laurentii]|uniref:Phosphotransferase n=1 Tax=Papiliotrema laurentii TaxID=5418 RepID=A0AAD9CXE8_PAPLA|nr:putative hexokinase [Papiliotrema laurentii]